MIGIAAALLGIGFWPLALIPLSIIHAKNGGQR